jgi:protein gp37
MADHSAIEWTDATWNPLRGCSRVSAGCQHCYAERVAARFGGPGMPYEGLIHPGTGGWNGKVKLIPEILDQPLHWKKPRMIFVNSMSDLFHESVPFEWIDRIWGVMSMAPRHTFQILTKRPERMLEVLPNLAARHRPPDGSNWPLPNVWLGVSVENQATADERIPLLLQCPAAVRWLSCEPLIGRVDLCEHMGMWWNQTMRCFEGTGSRINASHFMGEQRIGWVVAGGESGPGARPMHPDWARSLRDQCASAGVPFFFKQWGEHSMAYDRDRDDPDFRKCSEWDRKPGRWVNLAGGHGFHGDRVHYAHRVGKKAAGRQLDGVEHNAYPVVRS